MEILSFTEAEQLGREILSSGGLDDLCEWFHLSHTKLANHLATNTTTLRSWMADRNAADRMQATTIARVGQFAYGLLVKAKGLSEIGVKATDLYPLSLLAGEMGRSMSSPTFKSLCQQQRLTCYDIGVLGIYIPKDQAEQLRAKVLV